MTRRNRSGWNRPRRVPRRSFNTAEKRYILDRDGGICHVCGRPDATEADHVVPVAEGGAHSVDNGAPIHPEPCHREKSREESLRGYRRRQERLGPATDPHPFYVQET